MESGTLGLPLRIIMAEAKPRPCGRKLKLAVTVPGAETRSQSSARHVMESGTPGTSSWTITAETEPEACGKLGPMRTSAVITMTGGGLMSWVLGLWTSSPWLLGLWVLLLLWPRHFDEEAA